ncbi:PH domain-containing protein [Leucobacter luti]|uniref:PH domain-containing protein n=1 Tax=Leucobacter luti TaxID=340320 RepID=UPI003CFE02DB
MPPRVPRSVTEEVDSVLGPAPSSYAQPEVVVLRFGRHGRRLVLPVIALVAIAGLAGYFVGGFPAAWENLLAGIGAAVLALLLGILPVLAWLSHRTTVTSRRVIVRHGLFVHRRSEVPLGRVREVRTKRGPGQRMRGAGDIELLYGAEAMRLEDVPGVTRVAEALQELMERNFAQTPQPQQQHFPQQQFQQPQQAQQDSQGFFDPNSW